MSTQSDLTTLTARAQKAYSLKDYPTAVTLFADACELQAKLHGSDNDPRNAHLLYLYGKALYQVAISKSDILGGGAQAAKKESSDTTGAAAGSSKKQQAAESVVGDAALKKETALASKGKVISFQGDENWDNSEDEEGAWDDEEEDVDEDGDNGEGSAAATAAGAQEGEEEEDDMATAWEVLELARVLFHKSIDPTWTPQSPISSAMPSTPLPSELQETASAASTHPLTQAQLTSLQTQLSDVYDLLGEISLESENFNQATIDLRSSLTLKLSLFPPHDKLISEAHYKLSLALEFASAMEGISDEESAKGREDAAEEMELAVNSVKARIELEEEILDSKLGKGKGKGKESNQDDKDTSSTAAEKSLQEAKEIVEELEQRLIDLRAPPPQDELDSANPMISGLLKSVLGESPAEQKKRVEEAVKSANDVTGLVRKKAKKADTSTTSTAATTSLPLGGTATGKRKLEDVEMQDIHGKVVGVSSGEEVGRNGDTLGDGTRGSGVVTPPGSKKAKVEDSLDIEERKGGSAAVL